MANWLNVGEVQIYLPENLTTILTTEKILSLLKFSDWQKTLLKITKMTTLKEAHCGVGSALVYNLQFACWPQSCTVNHVKPCHSDGLAQNMAHGLRWYGFPIDHCCWSDTSNADRTFFWRCLNVLTITHSAILMLETLQFKVFRGNKGDISSGFVCSDTERKLLYKKDPIGLVKFHC